MSPEIAEAAGRSSAPDPDVYDRPASNRISFANLGLSIFIYIGVTIVVLAVLLWWFLR